MLTWLDQAFPFLSLDSYPLCNCAPVNMVNNNVSFNIYDKKWSRFAEGSLQHAYVKMQCVALRTTTILVVCRCTNLSVKKVDIELL